MRIRKHLGITLPLLAALLALAVRPVISYADHDTFCYAVGDDTHLLTRVIKADFNPATNETSLGPTGTGKTDGIALQPSSGTLYGVDTSMSTATGYLGTFNLSTGAFTRRASPFGSGSGRSVQAIALCPNRAARVRSG